jgi:hypothetical protein
MRSAIAVVVIISVLGYSALAQQPAPATDTSRGLLITYADGRMHTKPLRPTGGLWTPTFPRVPGAKPTYEGLPLTTIDFRHVVEGAEVVVTVSLSYGGAAKNQVKVATVRVRPGTPVEVTELRNYGVESVSLSIVSIPDTPATPTETFSPSSQLDIRAEQAGPNASSYRVVLNNRSDTPLMWIRLVGYREGKQFSGGQSGKRSVPLVEARSQHAFEIAIGPTGFVPGTESQAWSTIDRIEIVALMWQDGTVEGDRQIARQQKLTAERQAAELRTLIGVLTEGRAQSVASLRSTLSSVKITYPVVQESIKSLEADLDSLAASGRSRDDQTLEAWLQGAIRLHQEWVNRIVIPKVDR